MISLTPIQWAGISSFFAVLQVLGPLVMVAAGKKGFASTSDPLITPPGVFFSIWGVIEALSLLYSCWTLYWFKKQGEKISSAFAEFSCKSAKYLTCIYISFNVWLTFASIGGTGVLPTVFVFAFMNYCLFKVTQATLQHQPLIDSDAEFPKTGRFFLYSALGLYFGWSCSAVWLNILTVWNHYNSVAAGNAFMLLIIVCIIVTTVAITIWTKGWISFAIGTCWAVSGLLSASTRAKSTLFTVVCATGLFIVAMAFIMVRIHNNKNKHSMEQNARPVNEPINDSDKAYLILDSS